MAAGAVTRTITGTFNIYKKDWEHVTYLRRSFMIQVTAKELLKIHKEQRRKNKNDEIEVTEYAKNLFKAKPYYLIDKGIKNDTQFRH